MFIETIRLAWREIRGNLVRSSLTVLGIVIGISAVVTIIILSKGLDASVSKKLAGVGGNLLTLQPGEIKSDGAVDSARPFTVADVMALRRDVSSVVAVAPVVTRSVTATVGSASVKTTMNGTDNNYLATRNRSVAIGRAFADVELRANKSVCLLGESVRAKLFGEGASIDQFVRIGGINCQVIGILDTHGKGLHESEDDDLILAPLGMVQNRIIGRQDVGVIFLSAAEAGGTDRAIDDVRRLMRERRRNTQTDDDFVIRDLASLREKMEKAVKIISLTLGVIAGISLLVGGIGIMNIMLVSVTERTKEIGTRLAVGALPSDVLNQFLVEAMLLSLCGGVIGVCIGLSLSFGLSKAMELPYVVHPSYLLIATGASMLIGVTFGYAPARSAASLAPSEAMRHE